MHLMIITPNVEPIDLLGCFFSFHPKAGQTVREWCLAHGYRVEGDNERLKRLFADASVHTDVVLCTDTADNVLDCKFE
jgi:hypothetical protein